MPAKWHKYSYSARIEERRFALSVLVLVLILVFLFAIIHNHIVTMNSMNSSTMEPTLTAGDLVITTPLYSTEIDSGQHFSPLIKPERGDLVLLDPANPADLGIFLRSLDSIVAFITFQKFHPFADSSSWGERPSIRRLVAFPGDSVYMENFVLHIKKKDSSHFLTEFEVSDTTYDIRTDALPEAWSKDLPLSGSMDEVTLGPNEYFVLCDNRITASDSRTWGPIPAKRIRGKVILRYWPFIHAGKP
jgi:signal peptidase I